MVFVQMSEISHTGQEPLRMFNYPVSAHLLYANFPTAICFRSSKYACNLRTRDLDMFWSPTGQDKTVSVDGFPSFGRLLSSASPVDGRLCLLLPYQVTFIVSSHLFTSKITKSACRTSPRGRRTCHVSPDRKSRCGLRPT